MYLDNSDPNIVKVVKVVKNKGYEYQTVIGFDDESRVYILNKSLCDRKFKKNNDDIY